MVVMVAVMEDAVACPLFIVDDDDEFRTFPHNNLNICERVGVSNDIQKVMKMET